MRQQTAVCQAMFDSVGHGLFYHGRIRYGSSSFTFVYDCGAKPDKSYMECAIGKLGAEYSSLGLLVLSHLHEDHVNGIGKLLEQRTCQTAVIPYIYPALRLVLAIAGARKDSNYIDFMMDPIQYLLDKGVREVVVLGGPPQDPEASLAPDKDGIRTKNWVNAFEGKAYPSKVRFLDKTYLHLDCHPWEFKLYNLGLDSSTLTRLLKDLGDIIDGESITNVLANKSKVRRIRNVSKKHIGADINLSSIAMYHGPRCRHGDYKVSMEPRWIEDFSARLPLSSVVLDGVGTMLFGDLDLRDPRYQDLCEYFASDLHEVSLACVPHHGSHLSWNPAVLNDLPNASWVASHPELRLEHPHPNVSRDIMCSPQGPMFSSTEFVAVRITIRSFIPCFCYQQVKRVCVRTRS